MAESPKLNTTTLGGKTVYDLPTAGGPATNYFEMHSGGARAGVGEFLLTRADYDALEDELDAAAGSGGGDGTNTTKLVMKASDGSTGIELDVVVGGWLPHSIDVGGTVSTNEAARANDVVRVVVHDRRVRRTDRVNKFYNVQKEGFPGDESPEPDDFYESTISGGAAWTWADLLSNLEIPGNPTIPATPIAAPAWKPRNVIMDGVPFGRALDAIAATLYLVVGYKWSDDTYTLDAPGVQRAENNAIEAQAKDYDLDGAAVEAVRYAKRMPGRLFVRFKAYNQDDPSTDPFTSNNRYYEKEYTNADGNPNHKAVIEVGEYIAIPDGGGGGSGSGGSGGSVVNQTELDAVALDVAQRYLAFAKQPPGTHRYAGIWPFRPDGKIRGIRWQSTRAGATTTIRHNNDRDWHALTDFDRKVEALSNQLVVGLGETWVSLGIGGTRFVKGGGSGTLPQGQYQYMVYQMVSQNQAGWDFVRANPTL